MSLALFALLVLIMVAVRRALPAGRAHALWRALVPSWRFFDRGVAGPALRVRVAETHADELDSGSFWPLLEPPPRRALGLLFAPRANLNLACHDLLERLYEELAEAGPLPFARVEQLTSFQLLQHMVSYFLHEQRGGGSGARYQLQLVLARAGEPDEELFRSPFYPLSSQ